MFVYIKICTVHIGAVRQTKREMPKSHVKRASGAMVCQDILNVLQGKKREEEPKRNHEARDIGK